MKNDIMIVVDDDKISRMLPGVLLRPYGMVVIECDSGFEALKIIGTHHVSYMLIDISMPNISGIDLLKIISARSKYSKIQLVAYTADSKLGEDNFFEKLGFDHLLIKPITASDLLGVIGLSAI